MTNRGNINNHNTDRHDRPLSALGSGTSINSGGVKLVLIDLKMLKCINCLSLHPSSVYDVLIFRDNHHGHHQLQHDQQLQLDAARYRAERNNARLQVQEIKDKMKW